jgi:putative Mg2+ transporter-C (MgtC) family protein
MISEWEVVLRLVMSAFFGGLIGVEREINNRPAGLRTHVLVALGSSLIMMISMYGFNDFGDPARLAAQVVSGIGFLGAGTILNKGNAIKGLTTAASLWVCGGIGLAVGNGYYVGAVATVAIVLFTLITLGLLEKRFIKNKYRVLIVQCEEKPGKIGEIGQTFGRHNISIKDVKIISDGDVEDSLSSIEIHFAVKIPRNLNRGQFYEDILKIPGIDWVMWADGEPIERRKG